MIFIRCLNSNVRHPRQNIIGGMFNVSESTVDIVTLKCHHMYMSSMTLIVCSLCLMMQGVEGVDKGCRRGRDLLHRGVNRDLPSHHSARLAYYRPYIRPDTRPTCAGCQGSFNYHSTHQLRLHKLSFYHFCFTKTMHYQVS